jgi:hypothetical protein
MSIARTISSSTMLLRSSVPVVAGRDLDLLAATEDLGPVLGVPGIVLLLVAAPDARVREHHDPGLGTVHASLP